MRIEVRNKGKRDAPRAEVTFAVFLGETPADSKRYDYKWYPGIAAGRTVAVELPVELPEGRGVFSASAKAFGTRKRFKETVIPRTSTFLWVHQVADPPGLPVTVPR